MALPVGIGLAVVIYVMISIVTVGSVDWAGLREASLIEVAGRFMPRAALAYFIVGGALVACATTINIIFTIISRGLLVISAEGLLPSFMGRVGRRFGTPYLGLTAAFLVSALSLVVIPGISFLPSLMFFGSTLNLGLIFCISVVVLAGYVFPRRYPEWFSRARCPGSAKAVRRVCGLSLVLNALIFAFLMVAVGKAAFLFLAVAGGSFLYGWSKRDMLRGMKAAAARGGGAAGITWMERYGDYEETDGFLEPDRVDHGGLVGDRRGPCPEVRGGGGPACAVGQERGGPRRGQGEM